MSAELQRITTRQPREKPSTIEKPLLSDRIGEIILLLIFVALLSGRFALSRVFDNAPNIDLRFTYAGIAAVAILLWFGGGRKYLPKKVIIKVGIPFTIWCFWMTLSAFWAPPEAETTEDVIDFILLFLLITFSWTVMSRLPLQSLDKLWVWLTIAGLIYFALAIIAGPGDQGRYSAPGGGPNTFVRIMVAAAVAVLYLSISRRRTTFLLILPFFAVGAVLSGSRGGLVSAAIILLIFVVPLFRLLKVKKTLILGAFFGAASWFATIWRDGYVVDFVYSRFIQQTLIEGHTSGRDQIIDEAWDMFLQNPLFGIGIGGFYVSQQGGSVIFEYPHNLVLATLAEGGLVGGILLLFAMLACVRGIGKSSTSSSALFAEILGFYFFITSMFSGDYYDSRLMWLFFGFSAVIDARIKSQQKSVDNQN